MKTNIRYVLLTALRDKLFIGLFIGVLACAMISAAMGNMTMVEPQQLKLVYAAASARLVLVAGLIVFVCFHVRNGFDTKEIDVFLSRPISRSNLVLSYWMGFAVVALLLAVPTIGVVYTVGMLDGTGFVAWASGLLLEVLLVVAIALFSSFTLKSAVSSVMASFGFYILSRMTGFFIATANSSLLFKSQELNAFFKFVIEHVALIVPRLDFFSKTEWLVYGVGDMQDVYLFALQAAIFIPLLLLATIADFWRKQF
jgi:ABC-type transport system involved in multi-copper enzyme maturation permease subunit